jgi:hypothetical protein
MTNIRLWQKVSSFREFKQDADFKEYRRFPGVLLRFFGHAQTIEDEIGIKHYIRKEDLRKLDANLYQLPKLDYKILLNKVIRSQTIELQFPMVLSREEKKGIAAFIEKKFNQFTRSALMHQVYESNDPPFSIEFRNSDNKLSIFLEIPGQRAFDLIDGKDKEIQFYWPDDAALLGLTEEEMQKLDDFIEENREALNQEELEHPRKIERKEEGIPLSLLLVPGGDGKVGRIILLPRSEVVGIVGKGSSKAVKKAYDLTSGEFLVKKIASEKEGIIVRQLQDQKRVLKLRAETKKEVEGKVKVRQYELLGDGTVGNLINRSLTKNQKIQVIKQLLKALKAFHEKTTNDGARYYHGDIKPENILFKIDSDGNIRIFLSDFGFTNKRTGIAGTPAWVSPEQGTRWHKSHQHEPYDHQILGNELDVWGMGLVMASILSGRAFCDTFLTGDHKGEVLESLSKLTQSGVDEQIHSYRNLERDSELQSLWDIIRGMLSVNPQERWTAEQALEQFQEIN